MYQQSEKKLVNEQYLLQMSTHYGEFWPLTVNLDHPANFNRFHVLASLLQRRRSTKLCTTFGRLLGWYTIYTFSGALAP